MGKSLLASSMAALSIALSLPAYSGNIPGELRSARGEKMPNHFTSCCIYGSNPTGNNSGTTRTSNEGGSYGIFYWGGLDAGTYSQGFAETDAYGLMYRKDIVVPTSGDAPWTVMQHRPSVFCYGTEWCVPWHTWVAQSFRATGTSVCSISLRCAGSVNNADIEVAVLDGDSPYAPQIGPTRLIFYDPVWNMNPRAAYWSAGEVPTVPGRVYTFVMRPTNHSSGGQFSPYRQTVWNKARTEIPDGQAWYDGVPSKSQLETVVTADDQGFIHTVCCARRNGYEWVSSYACQTFIAKGSSVVAVTWGTNSDSRFAVSVHSGGPSGPQVGPTKYIKGAFWWDNRCVVTFAPGEAPTTPGGVYCVKIRRADGLGFALDTPGPTDFYSGGQAYTDGVARGFDFAVGIYEEKFPGALSQSPVGITNLRVDTITPNSAVVRWTSSPSADATVDFGEDTPYTRSVYNSTVMPIHAITLSGLTPNTMYHLRVISRASGAREGVSSDMVFVTAPSTPNLLADPGFESGSYGAWTRFGRGDLRVIGPWLGGAGPRTGNYGFAGAASGTLAQGGVYQRVAAVPGNEYKLSGWLFTYCDGNLWTKSQSTVTMVGLDPAGGTNAGYVVNPGTDERWIPNENVTWTLPTLSQNNGPPILYGSGPSGVWTNVATTVIAKSNYVTAFCYGGNDAPNAWSIFSFDDLVLTERAPTAVSITQALKDHADGAFLGVSSVICTDASQPGVYYVQSDNHHSGMRVETAGQMSLGERVAVSGYLATKASGERYLASAVVTSRAGADDLFPVAARLVSIGGTALSQRCPGVPGTIGPCNVGMLMLGCGKVTAHGAGCFYINDGSLPGNGLKVDTSSISAVPEIGQMVGVTGTVRLEGTAGSATVLLHPRSDLDVAVYWL
jgi:hypothetical protein